MVLCSSCPRLFSACSSNYPVYVTRSPPARSITSLSCFQHRYALTACRRRRWPADDPNPRRRILAEARICRIIILKTPRQGEGSTLHLCTVVCQFIVNIVLERLDPFFALLGTGRETWRAEMMTADYGTAALLPMTRGRRLLAGY